MVTIGLFDSGFGGLTVLREVIRQIPNANIEYFGDGGRAPYGERPKEEILKFTREIIEFLRGKNVDLVIIACNTATAASLDLVSKEYPLPILGVIGPGAIAGLEATKVGKIGVIATNFTIQEMAYPKEIHKHAPEVEVIGQACPPFGPTVEMGKADTPYADSIVAQYMSVFKDKGIDTLILGCTHYPLLMSSIIKSLPRDVKIVNPAVYTAKEALSMLPREKCDEESKATYRFYTTGDPGDFQRLGSRFLGLPILEVEEVFM